MKIALIGAAGVRTPLILQAMVEWQARLGLSQVACMDIDGERLDLIGRLVEASSVHREAAFEITRTTDERTALAGADAVITTFRVGGIEARVVDERVPLGYNVLGQETTGPGGFAMAMRSIPVLLDTVRLMREVCPQAWLVNFANPSGMMTEAVVRAGGWDRVVGICDSPATTGRMIAAALGLPPDEVFLDYFGLNHLGWLRGVIYGGRNYISDFLARLPKLGNLPGLPFDREFMAGLGMVPNEYLYYYYATAQAVRNIVRSGHTRGEQIAAENERLFSELRERVAHNEMAELWRVYEAYLGRRSATYMASETGETHDPAELDPTIARAIGGSHGYAGVALSVIEALTVGPPRTMILNVANRGAIPGLADDAVVEVPAWVAHGLIRPFAAGSVPEHCLGLMKQVKDYERRTITAATEGSYEQALMALALHPLVPDYATAKTILDEYRVRHSRWFPVLT